MKTVCFLLVILPLSGTYLHSQTWMSFTNTDNVRQIAIESDRVWGATSGGVVALTPSTGDILKLTNTDGLGGIDFNCVESDTAGNIWLGAADGWLSRYSPSGEITNYPVTESQEFFERAITVYDLFVDGDRVWMASDLGVSKFLMYSNDGEIKDTARRLGDIPDEEDVVCLSVIGDYLWAGTARGIAFIDKDNENIQYFGFWRSFQQGEDGLGSGDIRSIAVYHDTVIAGTQVGAYKLQVSPDTSWLAFGLAGRTINSLLMTDSVLLAATDGGVFQYDGSNWVGLSTSGLPQLNVSDIEVNASGDLWAGTPSSGLARLIDTLWNVYTIPGPASNFIRNIAIDSSGAIWMTHDGRGISRFENSSWTTYNSANSDPDDSGPLGGLDDNALHSITVDTNNDIWAGSWGRGLYRYSRQSQSWFHWENYNSPMVGVPRNNDYWAATAIQTGQDNIVWVSSMGADSGVVVGAFRPADSLWHVYHTGPNTVLDNDVTSLQIQGNSIWIGMVNGIHRLNFNGTFTDESDDSWQNYVSREFIVDTGLDPFGNLWFGALTGLYNSSPSTGITRRVDLPLEISGGVNAVASDGVGNIWVGTTSGLGVYRPNASIWKAVYNTSNSPLLNNQVTDIAIDVQTGLIYIGTSGGLSIMESGVEAPSEDLSDVEAYPNPVVVAAGDNALYFKRVPADATISIFSVAGDLVYELELSLQDHWDLKNSKGGSVAGGIYIFHVRSKNASGTGKFAIIK